MKLRTKLLLLFFLSGACGLIYEIVWVRMLTLVFGGTTSAVSTVLAVYMAGLALGSWYFGRIIDSPQSTVHRPPLRIFAFLMMGIGIYCSFTPFLFKGIEQIYIFLASEAEASHYITHLTLHITRFILGFIVLLIPTALMGGTLPVLTKYFVGSVGLYARKETPTCLRAVRPHRQARGYTTQDIGSNVGILYSVNTWGAVLGAFATGYILIMLLGVKGTLYLASTINLAIAGVVYVLSRHSIPRLKPLHSGAGREVRAEALATKRYTLHPPAIAVRRAGISRYTILLAIALSGFTALVYEVAWTRILTMILGSSVYAFSTMLTAFLFGIALGSFLYAKFLNERKNALALFGILEIIIGISVLLLIPIFGLLPFTFLKIFKSFYQTFTGFQFIQFLLSLWVMLIPTTLFGATFPLIAKIYTRDFDILGRSIGSVYAVNTLGAILGSLLAGFTFIPLFGLQKSIILVAFINIIIGIIAWHFASHRTIRVKSIVVATIICACLTYSIFIPPWDRNILTSGVFVYAKNFVKETKINPDIPVRELWDKRMHVEKIVYYKEGNVFTTTVRENPETGHISLLINGKVDASNNITGDMPTQIFSAHLPLLLYKGPSEPKDVLVIGLASGVTVGAVLQHPVKKVDCVEIEPAMKEVQKYFIPWNYNCLRDPRTQLIIDDGRNYLLCTKKKYDVIISEPSNPWISGCSNLFTREYFRIVKDRLSNQGIYCQWMQYYNITNNDYKTILRTFLSVFPYTTLWITTGGDTLLIGMNRRLSIDYKVMEKKLSNNRVNFSLKRVGLDNPYSFLTSFVMGEDTLRQYAGEGPLNTDNRPRIEFSASKSLYDDEVGKRNHQSLIHSMESVSSYLINFDNHLKLAQIYLKKQFYKSAVEDLQNIIRANPEDKIAHNALGYAFLLQNNLTEAEKEFRKVISLDPFYKEAYVNLGQVYLRQGDYGSAIKMTQRSIVLDPLDPAAYNNLAQIYVNQGEYMRAIEQFKNAINADPDFIPAYNNLGVLYLDRIGLPQQASFQFQKVLSINPNSARAYYNLGRTYIKLNKFGQAKQMFQKAINLDPKYAEMIKPK